MQGLSIDVIEYHATI